MNTDTPRSNKWNPSGFLTCFKSQRLCNSPSKMTNGRRRCRCKSHCLYLFSSKARLWSFDNLDSTSSSEDCCCCCWRRSQSLLLKLQQFTGKQRIYRATWPGTYWQCVDMALYNLHFSTTLPAASRQVRMGPNPFRTFIADAHYHSLLNP